MRIVVERVVITDLDAEQPAELLFKGDRTVIAHIAARDALERGHRISSAQKVRLLTDDKGVAGDELMALGKSVLEGRAKRVGLVVFLGLAAGSMVVVLEGIDIAQGDVRLRRGPLPCQRGADFEAEDILFGRALNGGIEIVVVEAAQGGGNDCFGEALAVAGAFR